MIIAEANQTNKLMDKIKKSKIRSYISGLWPMSPTNLSFENTEICPLRSDICLQRIVLSVVSNVIVL
jgi:hypothetical protein